METPRQIDTGSGTTLEYRGRLLYSRTEPGKRSVRAAAALSLKSATIYLLPSPLLLYGVAELIRKLPEGSLLLGVESDPALTGIAVSSIEKAGFNPRQFRFILVTGNENWAEILSAFPGWPYRRCEQLILNGGYALNRHYYDSLRGEIDTVIRLSYQDKITQVYLARRWLKNFFSNLLLLVQIPSYREIKDSRSVVVAGAGESLEQSLEEIRCNRDSIYLLAVDTALPCLTGTGIIPDAAVVLDAQFINMRDFYGVPTDMIDLIADVTAHPAVFRLPWRKRYAFFSRFSNMKFLTDRMLPLLSDYAFPAYGSVGIAAIAMARAISNAPAFFTGLDFCYRLGKSHARGTQFQLSEHTVSHRCSPAGSYLPFLRRPLLYKQGKNGRVLTDLILFNYTSAFKRLIRDDGEIFDLNPEGMDLQAPFSSSIVPDVVQFDKVEGSMKEDPKWEKSFQELLIGEVAYLDTIYRHGIKLLNGEGDWQAVYGEIDLHDYLYAHFPEHFNAPPREIVFLKRLLLSIEGYRSYLRSALDESG